VSLAPGLEKRIDRRLAILEQMLTAVGSRASPGARVDASLTVTASVIMQVFSFDCLENLCLKDLL
jgi:hypothetical protein